MTRKTHHLSQSETVEQIPLACADERAAIEFFEAQRWGGTPACVHCGSVGVYTIKDRKTGERREDGRWRCRDCGKQFTVRVGQIMEDSPIPLRKWAYAFWCAATAKNGVSALEMSRKIQITYKSALFMMNRIRWAMQQDTPGPTLDGEVEMDETYCGGKPRHRMPRRGNPARETAPHNKRGRGTRKTPVLAVVERGGDVRTRVVANVTADNIADFLEDHVQRGSRILTDDLYLYRNVAARHGQHDRVRHGIGEYVSPFDRTCHTNTVEGFFARVKRTLNGTHHAVSKEHLFRYLDGMAFMHNTRWMNDGERISHLIRSADGKRLFYKPPTRRAG